MLGRHGWLRTDNSSLTNEEDAVETLAFSYRVSSYDQGDEE